MRFDPVIAEEVVGFKVRGKDPVILSEEVVIF